MLVALPQFRPGSFQHVHDPCAGQNPVCTTFVAFELPQQALRASDLFAQIPTDGLIAYWPFNGSTGAKVDVETVLESGELQVEELCREGGVRLYDPEGGVVLRLAGSQPLTTAEALLEHVLPAEGRAQVIDVMGRERVRVELAPGSGSTTLDRGELESGVYWLVVEVDGQAFTMPFGVVR